MRMNSPWPVLVALLLGCGEPADDAGLGQLRASMVQHAASLDTEERRVRKLSARWRDIEERWQRVSAQHSRAESRLAVARSRYGEASAQFASAVEDWRASEGLWKFYQALVLVAAQIDARNLDAYRAYRRGPTGRGSKFSCSKVSTATFRRQLVQLGVSVVGKDVDHIVPRSLGGADHPSNYQLLDASKNRSLGAEWTTRKCAVSNGRCAEAVAVSRKCGSFRGSLP